MPLIADDGPCEYVVYHMASIESSEGEAQLDETQIGLIVFLVIFFVFTSLTSGLLVCLTKIWCCKGEQRTIIASGGEKMSEKRRAEILNSQEDDSDDDDTPSGAHTPRSLLTTRVMDFVHRSFRDRGSKRRSRKKSTPPGYAPTLSVVDHEGTVIAATAIPQPASTPSPSPSGGHLPRIWDGSESPTMSTTPSAHSPRRHATPSPSTSATLAPHIVEV